MQTVAINKDRISYLLSLNKMTAEEFLSAASKGLKRTLTWEDVYRDCLSVNTLKRIDSVFKKGLFYYADPETPQMTRDASVFFRKESFGTELNLGSRLRVREFEDLKIRLNTIAKLSDVNLGRRLPVVDEASDPRGVAFELRERLLPEFTSVKRDFLRDFMNRLGDNNVFVFEFVDIKQKKEKANVDGFYLSPNAIVLKRRQESFSREIFTLAHETGHYLLDKEEIEEVDVAAFSSHDASLSSVEQWCNTFAYFLLLGRDNAALLDSHASFDGSNDYGHDLVAHISECTNLSRLAIFTNLLLQKKLSYDDYLNIKEDLAKQWKEKEAKRALQKELDIANGIRPQGRNPQPIRAEIVREVYSVALSSGVVGEQEYCKAMRIKPSEINAFRYL